MRNNEKRGKISSHCFLFASKLYCNDLTPIGVNIMNQNVIHVKHTSIIVPNYTLGQVERLEKMLSFWNKTHFRWETIGFVYDEETKQLRLPRGLDLNYIEKVFQMPLQIDYEPDPYETASFRLKKEPRTDIQRKSISYLLGEGDFAYTRKHSQLALNLDTGDGKTYCVIAALTFLKMKAVIITHNDNVKGQWKRSLLGMTDIDEQYILDIDGSSTIRRILKASKLPFKIFLINHRSIQSFAKKEGWNKITELFQKLKVGVKVYDEAHLEFENMIKTDLYTNTKKTIYLTANFERSHYRENKIFSLCFKNIAKYGKQTRKEKRRHIVYVAVKYNSKPNLDAQMSVRGPHGLDKNKYIDYQLTKDIFYNVILYVLKYISDKEGKILMLFSKNDAIDTIYNFLTKENIEKTIGIYNSVVSEEEKEQALLSDIILSTPKSLGTGSDIPGLRFNIMTEPYTSPITANQTSGRLREYAEDKFTFHFELVDVGFRDVERMYKKRLPIFKEKCAQIFELEYDDKKLLQL